MLARAASKHRCTAKPSPHWLPAIAPSCAQVIPIYGRGGNEDPRSKSKGELDTVPQRPAGQRPAPIMRIPLLQPNVNINAQQSGLGIIPTLFGLQNGNGGWRLAATSLRVKVQ